jgi:hypothetical protein
MIDFHDNTHIVNHGRPTADLVTTVPDSKSSADLSVAGGGDSISPPARGSRPLDL